MEKLLLKEVIMEQQEIIQKRDIGIPRENLASLERHIKMPHVISISGIRRSGKSTLMAQIMKRYYKSEGYYLNFEDDRLLDFEPQDFSSMYELFLELFGEGKAFFLDEIQNVPKWESFVRRMYEKGAKIFVTGSNASLLSREFGTKLTGRYLSAELYPFSFKEYLILKKHPINESTFMKAADRAKIKRLFGEYLKKGGMPEYLKYEDADILKRVYDDIIYRDVVARYRIEQIKTLREIAFYLMTNFGNIYSYNKLKNQFKLGSVNTVKNYVEYLENSYLLFEINSFSYSYKKQLIAPKKIYGVDNGLLDAVIFAFSSNRGRFLENMVFQHLQRKGKEIYYFKTKKNLEVDFIVKKGNKILNAIQVSQNITKSDVREREVSALIEALKELGLKNGLILTEDDTEEIKIDGIKIEVKPIYRWMLEDCDPQEFK